MQPQLKAIQLIAAFIKEKIGIAVTLSPLPEDGGTTIEVTAARTVAVSLDRQHQQKALPLLILCKNKDQLTAMDTVAKISNCLSSAAALPSDEDVQILSAVSKSDVNMVDKVGDYWIYSAIVDINIYYELKEK